MLHHLGAIVLICTVGVEALKLSSILTMPSTQRLNTKISSSTTSAQSEQAQSGLGWDSHEAIQSIPESLVKTIDGNETMRRKFEQLCRRSQVPTICRYYYCCYMLPSSFTLSTTLHRTPSARRSRIWTVKASFAKMPGSERVAEGASRG